MSSQQPDGMWVKAEVVMTLEAEIATLRQERDACCEFCNKPRFSGEGEAQGMDVCTDCWNEQFRRREAAEAENVRLRADGMFAAQAIRAFVGMGACPAGFDRVDLRAFCERLSPPAETDHE